MEFLSTLGSRFLHSQMGHGARWSEDNGLLDFPRVEGGRSLLPEAPRCTGPSAQLLPCCCWTSPLGSKTSHSSLLTLHCSPPTWSPPWEESCNEGHAGVFAQGLGARAGLLGRGEAGN